MKKTLVYILLVFVVAALMFLVGKGDAQDSPEPPFKVEFEQVIKDDQVQEGLFKIKLVDAPAEGTGRLTYLCQGEEQLTPEMKDQRGWGEWNIATPDSPEIRPEEWLTMIPDGCDALVSRVFLLIRGNEGGWPAAIMTEITDLIFDEQRAQFARSLGDAQLLSEANDAGMIVDKVQSGDEFEVNLVEREWAHVRRLSDNIQGWIQVKNLQIADEGTESVRRYGDICWETPVEVRQSDRFRWRWELEFPSDLPEDFQLFFRGERFNEGTDYRFDSEHSNIIQLSNVLVTAARPRVVAANEFDWTIAYDCEG